MLTFVSNNFEIKKRPIQVTATAGQFKIYGDDDLVFAYTVTSGSLAYTDSFTGALSRVAGQDVGLYAITIGTLAISDGNSGNNYMGWTEAADLILKGLNGAIASKRVTYDFARLMDGATEIKCSVFGDNIIEHM